MRDWAKWLREQLQLPKMTGHRDERILSELADHLEEIHREALAEGAWQAEPQDALQVFLAYGGQEFLDQHPQAVVNLHLAESEEEGPVWTIAALDPADRSLLSLAVSAETRQVLSVGP